MLGLILTALLLSLHTISAAGLLAGAEPPTVTAQEARRLAYAALPEGVKRLPGLTLLPSDPRETPPRCTTFDVLWNNPEPASVHVGFWAVDMRTGEVWEPILCERVTNAALRVLQEATRKKLGVTVGEFRRALKDNPCCTRDPFATSPGPPPQPAKKEGRR